ncbi:Adaptive-response sensory-kinase SasA [anaerobic digester metagenome]
MGNNKKGVIIPFTGKSNNESINTSMTVASGQGSFEESAARDKLNVERDLYNEDKIMYSGFSAKGFDDSKNMFLNIYSELKVPMDIIYGASQLLEQHLKNNYENSYDDKTTKSMNSIKQNFFRLTKMINNLLDLSIISAEQYDLNCCNANIVSITENVVVNVVKAVEAIRDKQLEILFDTDSEEKMILFDPKKMERVILNILSNAVRSSTTGGKIFVNFRTVESRVEISVDYEEMKTDSINHKNVMDISGMKNQQFGDYNKEESIELILSRSITNLHGGNLWVEHSQGDRIKFVLSLPCKKNDSIYYLYSKECPIAADNLLTKINIEFSDLINTGWN